MPLAEHARAGRLTLRQVDPAELTAGEFSYLVQQIVEKQKRSLIVIDSVNGYYQALPEAKFLNAHLHELLAYLTQQGVTTFITLAQYGLLGSATSSPVDVSYLADAVILLRYFEAGGEIRQAISMVKKRSGGHERAIREYSLGPGGIRVGQPLKEFQGVLGGLPRFMGKAAMLRQEGDESE